MEICGGQQITRNVSIVLFLNKCDLLLVSVQPSKFHALFLTYVSQAKLKAGVMLNHHMVLYGDRSNDYDSVLKKCIHWLLLRCSLVSFLLYRLQK